MSAEIENQQESNNKEIKRFDANFKKMVSLLQGNKDVLFKTSKIPNEELKNIVDELFKEEIEGKRETLKAKIKEVCAAHIAFSKEERKAREELEKTILNKKKEMNKTFETLFNEVENINTYHNDFEKALGTQTTEEPKA